MDIINKLKNIFNNTEDIDQLNTLNNEIFNNYKQSNVYCLIKRVIFNTDSYLGTIFIGGVFDEGNKYNAYSYINEFYEKKDKSENHNKEIQVNQQNYIKGIIGKFLYTSIGYFYTKIIRTKLYQEKDILDNNLNNNKVNIIYGVISDNKNEGLLIHGFFDNKIDAYKYAEVLYHSDIDRFNQEDKNELYTYSKKPSINTFLGYKFYIRSSGITAFSYQKDIIVFEIEKNKIYDGYISDISCKVENNYL